MIAMRPMGGTTARELVLDGEAIIGSLVGNDSGGSSSELELSPDEEEA